MEIIEKARFKIVRRAPYLATALYAVTSNVIVTEKVPTAAVDMWGRLYINPDFATTCDEEEFAGVIVHEIWHLLRLHFDRMKDAPTDVANVAADLEINDDVIASGFALPQGALLPERFGFQSGLLAEEYLKLLDKRKEENTQESEEESASDKRKTRKTSRDERKPGAGRCGSAATGRPEEWEVEGRGSGSGLEKEEIERIARKVAQEAIEHARGQGRVPLGVIRWAKEMLKTKLPLPQVLARVMAEITQEKQNYTWRRPNKRFEEVYLPSLVGLRVNVAVVLDTSGSMDEERLALAIGALDEVLKKYNAEATVIPCDAKAYEPIKVKTLQELLKKPFKGGGGTVLVEGIKAAANLKPKPDAIFVITDGEYDWPDEPPTTTPVIVILVGEGKSPAWAKTIKAQ
ncbi:MAG: VWA-like domain-containing protein [Thermofilum sp.]